VEYVCESHVQYTLIMGDKSAGNRWHTLEHRPNTYQQPLGSQAVRTVRMGDVATTNTIAVSKKPKMLKPCVQVTTELPITTAGNRRDDSV